jgi:hypothetical protein
MRAARSYIDSRSDNGVDEADLLSPDDIGLGAQIASLKYQGQI